ncbi:MAG: NAD-glutamate dehydrogenase [Xanthobacteraceae bacterium]|nr:NAD-glutamate dehydrogenase [Xanthobacteraceae bacterium]QYK44959.1 MAG: NAD-glutamate dehydrogenase [Xanthobacteraceae bacterium]
MNVASRLASGEALQLEKLLGEAAKLASAGNKVPADFVAALFGGAAPEDVANYSPGELAAIARRSFEHLRTRPAGAADIQIYNPAAVENGGMLSAITIIEIENEDMPFLLDSVTAELVEQGLTVRLAAHPIFSVERESNGTLAEWRGLADGGKKKKRESFIHLHVARIDEGRHGGIAGALQAVLEDVRLCVEDWPKMKEYADDVIDGLQKKSHPLPEDEIEEAVAFLKWLRDDHFTFLGCRDNVLMASGDSVLEPVFDSGLGILRRRDIRVLSRAGEPVSTSQELREFLKLPLPLIVTKANLRSRVHRRAHMDYIGIKRFDKNGKLTGERRIVGLFTSPVYRDSVFKIPFLRRKAAFVLDHAGFSSESHSGKALANVLESYPRDDLFQVDRETLLGFAKTILQLDERPRVRVLARRDRFNRFVSVIVFVPRERYDSAVRVRIGAYLAETYQGRVSAFYPFFPEGPLTRVHFIIGRDAGETPNPAREKLEADITAIVRNWQDRFAKELSGAFDPDKAQAAETKYRNAFSAAYREAYGADVAVEDIRIIDNLSSAKPLAINFYRRGGEAQSLNLKVWNCERPMPLSERVPLLENMGFNVIDERTYTLERCAADGGSVWLHDMTLARADGSGIDAEAMDARLEAALMAVLQGRAENDGFNALVLNAGMPWRDVTLVRTLARYLRQAAIPYSQDYLWTTLNRHAQVARDLVALFHTRFDPRFDGTPEQREAIQAELRASIETALGAVQSLDEDRILRRFTNLIGAAVRTNYYQIAKDGGPRPTIAIKFESRKIDALPLPRPLFEIFVYAPRVEGVHLRFGKVARGGIRWSDRPQDFRTEVLGLVKAQQVKNAVIVPVGAKGGFVPKLMPANPSREAFMAEGTEAYKIFIRSLLDITDNLSAEGAVIVPENTVRHDADDPYLVVAADKGTATFSDTANALAIEHGFWLGDAFASGGSAGYDHKKMGITARGAWEAVKRHFREMDVDISRTAFTVAGVGDMSGDVFGNGMLLEKTIKLIAAFDHRDIFFDPSPDPEKSFNERARMFALPRSSWQDYDKSLLSKGGGIFPRSLKAIPLSPEMQAALSLEKSEATPAEVMNAILKMPVDLLWFGGIGTYIRAASESDAGVGDRANDAIRISGAEVAAKVVGEGANLGMTQRGRIEAARKGVRLNTDAIDNSAGVNSSDVEVNLKIALSTPVRAGKLSLEDRNKLLAAMTPDVAALVLRNNYLQTLAISLVERDAANDTGFEIELMRNLERRGLLDRGVEYLPSDIELAERQAKGLGLTRPELAVTLAYAKLTLFDDLVASDAPDEPYFNEELLRYFPDAVPERFPDAVETHRLRREIIATRLGNSIINRGGPAFVTRIADETGASAALIAKAYAAVRDGYRLTDLNKAIDALDAKIPGVAQLALYETVKNLLLERVVWFVRNADFSQGLAKLIAHYREGIDTIEQNIEAILPKERVALLQARTAEAVAKNVPEVLAAKLARLPELTAASDIVLIAGMSGQKTRAVAETYFAAEDYFRLDRVLAAGASVKLTDHFDRLAFDLALSRISASQRRIVSAALQSGKCGAAAIEAWAGAHKSNVERARRGVQEIADSGLTLAKLTVAANLIGELVSEA